MERWKNYEGKDLWKRLVLSLEWKREGVMDGDSGDGRNDELMCVRSAESGNPSRPVCRRSFFTALHVMQTRYSEENSVCLSVRPSVCLSHA